MDYGTTEKENKGPKGFVPIFKREAFKLRDGQLGGLPDFAAHILYVLFAYWDINYSTYGCIRDDKKMEEVTGVHRSTWCRYRNRFVRLGMYTQRHDGHVEIPHYWKYEMDNAIKLAKMDIANLEEENEILQNAQHEV